MGHIYVNQKKIEKSGYKIKSGSILRLKLERQWVSRGGIKLSYALKKFKLKVGQKICLDIGCSTGGFSDVLLKNGADLRTIQIILGHESITTTEIYTHLDTYHLDEVLKKFHPRK